MQHGTVGDVGDEGVDKARDRVWIGFDVDIDAPLGSDGRGRRTDRGDDLRESVDPDGVDERIDRRTGGEDDGVCRSAGETTAVVDVGRDRAVGDDLVDVPAHHPQMDRQGLAGDLGSGEHHPTARNRWCGERDSETLGDRIGRHEIDGETERLGPIAGSGTDHCDPNAIGEWALTERVGHRCGTVGRGDRNPVAVAQDPQRRAKPDTAIERLGDLDDRNRYRFGTLRLQRIDQRCRLVARSGDHDAEPAERAGDHRFGRRSHRRHRAALSGDRPAGRGHRVRRAGSGRLPDRADRDRYRPGVHGSGPGHQATPACR